jgi:hypothetical protein
MQIDDLTVGQARQLASLFGQGQPSHPWQVGKTYLIRTVTHYWTGRLVAVHGDALVLEDAAWIADTGRFHAAVQSGLLNEVEPVPRPVIVGRGAIVDATEWTHKLPREAK